MRKILFSYVEKQLADVKEDETDDIQTDHCFFQKVKLVTGEKVYFLNRDQLHLYYFLPLIVNNKTNLNCA